MECMKGRLVHDSYKLDVAAYGQLETWGECGKDCCEFNTFLTIGK